MNVLDNGLLKCSICGASNYKNLTRHITSSHKIKTFEYSSMFPDDLIYTEEMQKNFSKGGYKANEVMKEKGHEFFSERSKKARATELENDPDAYYKRNHKLMETIPGFIDRATDRILKQSSPYKKHPHKYKGKVIIMKSSWEDRFATYLESLNVDYRYEPFRVKYYNPYQEKIRDYYPDFIIEGTNLVLEVKPSCDVNDITVQAKAQATKDLGYRYLFITEENIFYDNYEDLLNELKRNI